MKETKTPLEKAVLYVVLTVIAFIAIFPLLYIILASFRTNKEIFEYALPFTWKTLIPQNWTMNNYVAIFSEMGYGTALKNTLIVVAILVPLNMMQFSTVPSIMQPSATREFLEVDSGP